MIVEHGVEGLPGFLNPGCVILRFWKSSPDIANGAPRFPRLPQAPAKALCKAASLCEKHVHERMA